MTSDERTKAVVEPLPDGAEQAEIIDAHALQLRLRQQEILAQFGVSALRGTSLAELLDESTRLSALGLEAEFAKVRELGKEALPPPLTQLPGRKNGQQP